MADEKLLTRVKKSQIDLPKLDSLIEEVEDARGSHDNLAERFSAIDGSITSVLDEIEDVRAGSSDLSDKLAQAEELIGRMDDKLEELENILDGIRSETLLDHVVVAEDGLRVVEVAFEFNPEIDKLMVFRNGLLQRMGEQYDYIINDDGKLEFNLDLLEDDLITVMLLR